jgi:uncharacterized membrane protein
MGVQLDGKTAKNTRKSKWLKVMGVALVVMAVFLMDKTSIAQAETIKNGDLRILKKEVTSKAKFYPVTVDGVKMEVVAVKASDGSIRTAFNTCQVCFDSGRGYYIQEGAELVCQNCGNRFQIDRVEKIKNGCNPVPITADLKTDDGKYITISKTLLAKAKGLFGNWKR